MPHWYLSQCICQDAFVPGGGGRNYHPLLKNHDFSGTDQPLDLRAVCKLEFVRCGPVEKKNRALHLSRFDHGGPKKFEDTFFKKIIFTRFRQNDQFFENSQGMSLKARCLIFWILTINIHI